jgi:O-antigen/teichoic acid export membrane protein
MTEKILGTFLNRLLTTAIMFAVIIINTNQFGPEGTGTIAIVILGLTLLQVLSNFVGGSTLVYLTPQRDNFQLLLLSYAWMLVSTSIGVCLLDQFDLVPNEYILFLFILSIIINVYFIHIGIIQGKEDIKLYNLLQLTQAVLLILLLGVTLFLHHHFGWSIHIRIYLRLYLISYLVPCIISCFYIRQNVSYQSFDGIWRMFGEMVKLGCWTQVANLAQLLTYRTNYFLIQRFINDKSLGIYDLGSKISEAVLIIPKSICVVEYARISNNQDPEYSKLLTLSLLKFVLAVILIAVLVLWLLPASFFGFIFGPEYAESKPVINSLLPGIVSLSCLSILSHYFAGHGKFYINAIGSFIGLAVTVALGFTWLSGASKTDPVHALQIAGYISSIAYTCTFVYTLVCFVIQTKAVPHDFMITREDFKLLKESISSISLFHKKDSSC